MKRGHLSPYAILMLSLIEGDIASMHKMHVVLSYCQADHAIAQDISATLAAAGADVWHDASQDALSPPAQCHIIKCPVFI
jgi:hypothetical protein